MPPRGGCSWLTACCLAVWKTFIIFSLHFFFSLLLNLVCYQNGSAAFGKQSWALTGDRSALPGFRAALGGKGGGKFILFHVPLILAVPEHLACEEPGSAL